MTRNYILKKVEVFKKLSTGSWDSNSIELDDATDIEVRKGLGKRKDTFSFKIRVTKRNNIYETLYSGDGSTRNFTLKYGPINSDFVQGANKKCFVYVDDVLQAYTTDYTISGSTLTFAVGNAPSSGTDNIRVVFPVVESGDLIRISQVKNTTSFGNSDILIEGTCSKPEFSVSATDYTYTVNGYGIIENLFSSLVFVKDSALTKPHLIIQNILTQINNYNRLRKIYGENSTEWDNIGNATKKSDNTDFSDIQYYSSYRPALEIIEEVSSDRYTKDGAYYFYVQYNGTDDRHEFHWSYKDPSADSSKSLAEGSDNIKKIKVYKDDNEVVNTVIYNVGVDCYGTPQEFLNHAQVSVGSKIAKWKYVLETNHIISDLINQEFEENRALWDTAADGTRTSNFPNDTSSWTFQFETRNDDGTLTGTKATATSDKTFNDAIVEEARWRGKEATDRILEMFQAPRIKAEVTLPFTTNWTLGDLIPVTSETFNLNKYPLRIVEIKHTDTDTILYLEEDETTAIERVISGG